MDDSTPSVHNPGELCDIRDNMHTGGVLWIKPADQFPTITLSPLRFCVA